MARQREFGAKSIPDIVQRTREVMDDRNLSIREFAEQLDSNAETTRRYLSAANATPPSLEFVLRLVSKFGVNERWLLFGEGGRYLEHEKSESRHDLAAVPIEAIFEELDRRNELLRQEMDGRLASRRVHLGRTVADSGVPAPRGAP